MFFRHFIRFVFLAGFLFWWPVIPISFAQMVNPSENAITGTILDSETGKPIEFATISLFKKNFPYSDSLITGAITPGNGKFFLKQIPSGIFQLEISFIGYKSLRKDSISISEVNPVINLGKISLSPNSELLKEVEVVGEKHMIEMAVDKKIFNVEKNITSTGGSATDVLQNIPSVAVDIDGNVSLRGSGNVTVLIDGRPSGITGASRTAVLQQIPASSIESVEVITNPSVKYDPDGMSGIINIILKKNQKKGANGSISAGIGTRNKYNAALNFNYRNKKINAFVNYGFRYNPVYGNGSMTRENFFSDSTWYLNQYSKSQKTVASNMVKAGMDFFIDDANTLGISSAFSAKNDADKQSIEYQNFNINKILTGVSLRGIDEDEASENIDVAANFKHSFKKPKQNISIDFSFSTSKETTAEEINQQDYSSDYSPLPLNPILQNTFNNQKFNVAVFQSDYSHPLGVKSKIETGVKSIVRNINNEFVFENFSFPSDKWQKDSLRYNHYIFDEQVHAAYATYSNTFGKINFQAGARLEQAITKSELLQTNTVGESDYFSYFPGGHFAYQLNKQNQLQLSYSKRINRPSVESLIAFMDYDDPLNVRLGNPKLKPEYIHSAELSWALQNEKNTLTTSMYYRKIVDMIQRYRIVDSSGVATITYQNYSGATNTGFEFVARNEFFKWMNLTSNLNLFRSEINASNIQSDLHNEGFSWSAKMTVNIILPAGFQVQIAGDYKAPAPVALGTMYALNGVDAGIKKELFKGKGNLNLNMSDVFNTRQFEIDIVQPTYHHRFIRKRESQIFTINFTYKIGKSDPSQKQKARKEGENQQIRGEDLF